ncbi:non-SMC mitotic condensation complex subunit 1-domain-containing protein [Gongronella butleri]|nr:non-SMC mitotic condensation complex subunit 1-domain-containing protein [Gongronella butleri]
MAAADSEFVLQEEVQVLQQGLCDYPLESEIDIEGQSDKELARALNAVTESIEISSRSIVEADVFGKLGSFVKNLDLLSTRITARLVDITLSAFRSEITATSEDIHVNDTDTFAEHRVCLERYIFLSYWMLMQIEDASHRAETAATSRSKKGAKTNEYTSSVWVNHRRKIYDTEIKLLDLKLSKIWTLPQDRTVLINMFTKPCYTVFESSALIKMQTLKDGIFEILSICVKRYDHLLAAQTTVMQTLQYWEHSAEPMADFLCHAIDKHDYTQLAHELLRQVSNQEFKDAAAKELKDTANPKTFSAFLLRLTDATPKTIVKNLGLLTHQLDSDSYTMRMCIVEMLGKLIVELSQSTEEGQPHRDQINGFFDILEERMLDPIAFCRVKVLQVYLRILDMPIKFPKRRQTLVTLACRHLEDKSSSVRKMAVRVLNRLISTHPFDMYGGELKLSDWQDRLTKLEEELKVSRVQEDENGMRDAFGMASMSNGDIQDDTDNASTPAAPADDASLPSSPATDDAQTPKEAFTPGDAMDLDDDDDAPTNGRDEASQPTVEQQEGDKDAEDDDDDVPISHRDASLQPVVRFVSQENMQQLKFMQKFLADAVEFIKQLEACMPHINQFLSSKSKLEVVEAMDFYMTAYLYKVNHAKDGIRKMLHLIWTKDTSDEGKGIKLKLLECYRTLYIDMDRKLSKRQNIALIAKNLIELTYNATLADLTSLEQILTIMIKDGIILPQVIEKLWEVYGFSRGQIPKHQRRGAIIILGMFARADTSVVAEKVDLMLEVGLGAMGKADLSLARYTCIALQRLAGTKNDQARGVYEGRRFPMTHAMFGKLRAMIEVPTTSMDWFGMCEQALNTVYGLGERPDQLCGDMIKTKTKLVFIQPDAPPAPPSGSENGNQDPSSPQHEQDQAQEQEQPLQGGDDMDVDQDTNMTGDASASGNSVSDSSTSRPIYLSEQSPFLLSQLVFMVGHVAIKQTVYLELLEAVWKRKKTDSDKEKLKNAGADEAADELEQVGGSAEDDIGDAILRIREHEILFSPHALLAKFGPMLTEICARNRVYSDRTLQAMATLSLGKFMCVSSEFCERHLRLLLTILEKSKDATIRSNIVIALGDMAVCFSTLIDDNISFLYNRLGDEDNLVKKNTVMVLTHLILNGMVKVKGQISEMAKCLEDADHRIADLAKLFFTELATKDNAIYNNLPDIISNLTSTPADQLSEEGFHRIMKFIFSFDFVEKGKQAENIVEKMCQRFKTRQDERGWRDIAYCLSLLPMKSEKSFRKLVDNFPLYQDKLHEESVHKSFTEIISKGRAAQKLQKADYKAVIDELESKIESVLNGGNEPGEQGDSNMDGAADDDATQQEDTQEQEDADNAAAAPPQTQNDSSIPLDPMDED